MARPLIQEETLILRAFQRQVNRLRQSSIVQLGKANFEYSTKITFPSGQIDTTFTGYDTVAFQAQLPILRQFLLQDDISFNRVHNILNQCCDRQDLLDWTRYARRKWVETLARLPLEEHRYFRDAQHNVEAAVEKLFYGYGGLFHADIHEPDEEEEVREIQEATLQNAFPYFWNCLNNLDSVIHIWLDERTSASSSLNFGVETLEFVPRVVDFELPVDAALLVVGLCRPSSDFLL